MLHFVQAILANLVRRPFSTRMLTATRTQMEEGDMYVYINEWNVGCSIIRMNLLFTEPVKMATN